MLHGGARVQNLGHLLFFFTFFFLNGIIQFKQQVHILLKIDFLSETSDCRVQCPRVGLEVNI